MYQDAGVYTVSERDQFHNLFFQGTNTLTGKKREFHQYKVNSVFNNVPVPCGIANSNVMNLHLKVDCYNNVFPRPLWTYSCTRGLTQTFNVRFSSKEGPNLPYLESLYLVGKLLGK